MESASVSDDRRKFRRFRLREESSFVLTPQAPSIGEIINIGSGTEVTITELAELVKRTVGYEGELRFDPSKPDGTPRKLLDVSKSSISAKAVLLINTFLIPLGQMILKPVCCSAGMIHVLMKYRFAWSRNRRFEVTFLMPI